MNKKLILIVAGLVSAPVFAMQSQPLKPWVVAATQVRVTHPQLNVKLPVMNSTTIQDLKNNLLDREGIPVDQQLLRPHTPKWFFRTDVGPILSDSVKVKDAMSQYNTGVLGLYLTLQRRVDNPYSSNNN